MRILFFDWGAYTFGDTKEAFCNAGIEIKTVTYCFDDKNHDDFFLYRFSKELKECTYDAVFSINYFPLVAECCHKENVKYIAWSYDNPLNVYNIEETLGYSTNFVFLFDRVQAADFIKKGYDNVFHLPLAVNCERLDKIIPSKADFEKYGATVSFVGKLYDSEYPVICAFFDDYQKGYVDALINSQRELYGCYLLDNAITEGFIKSLNDNSQKKQGPIITREALNYSVSAEVTRRERLMLLSLIGRYFDTKLYSREKHDFLKDVKFMGSAGYLYEMPLVFKTSKISLNNTLKCLQTGIPLRALDILGSGGFLLTNYQEEIAEYFEDGTEIVLYESASDAYEKVSFYAKKDDLREKIAKKGYEKARNLFNYKDRIKYMLEIAGVLK